MTFLHPRAAEELAAWILTAVISFVAGLAFYDHMQERSDAAKKAELGRQAYLCRAYGKELAVNTKGEVECRNLMARFEPWWPIPGDPVRLKRGEIKRAVGG